MALEATFHHLSADLLKLREALLELHLTVAEDRPLKGASAFVERFSDAIEDMRGLVEDARLAAAEGGQAVGRPVDLDRARRALATAHEKCNRLARQYALDLVSYQRVDQLTRLGRERGGEWQAWASSVKEGLERCRQPLDNVNEAFFQCWQEIAERVGMNSVSVQATNIGQQIVAPESERAIQEELGQDEPGFAPAPRARAKG